MSGKIPLGCANCDRTDFDGVDEFPADWTDIAEVQSFAESIREVDWNDRSRSPLDWQIRIA